MSELKRIRLFSTIFGIFFGCGAVSSRIEALHSMNSAAMCRADIGYIVTIIFAIIIVACTIGIFIKGE